MANEKDLSRREFLGIAIAAGSGLLAGGGVIERVIMENDMKRKINKRHPRTPANMRKNPNLEGDRKRLKTQIEDEDPRDDISTVAIVTGLVGMDFGKNIAQGEYTESEKSLMILTENRVYG